MIVIVNKIYNYDAQEPSPFEIEENITVEVEENYELEITIGAAAQIDDEIRIMI